MSPQFYDLKILGAGGASDDLIVLKDWTSEKRASAPIDPASSDKCQYMETIARPAILSREGRIDNAVDTRPGVFEVIEPLGASV